MEKKDHFKKIHKQSSTDAVQAIDIKTISVIRCSAVIVKWMKLRISMRVLQHSLVP